MNRSIETRLEKLENRHNPLETVFSMTAHSGEVITVGAGEFAEVMRMIDGKTTGLPAAKFQAEDRI